MVYESVVCGTAVGERGGCAARMVGVCPSSVAAARRRLSRAACNERLRMYNVMWIYIVMVTNTFALFIPDSEIRLFHNHPY